MTRLGDVPCSLGDDIGLEVSEPISAGVQHLVDDEGAFPRLGELMHAIRVLYEVQDEVADVECPAPNLAAVIAVQVLLIDGQAGKCELSSFLEGVKVILLG
jgi:hypothetical protein